MQVSRHLVIFHGSLFTCVTFVLCALLYDLVEGLCIVQDNMVVYMWMIEHIATVPGVSIVYQIRNRLTVNRPIQALIIIIVASSKRKFFTEQPPSCREQLW